MNPQRFRQLMRMKVKVDGLVTTRVVETGSLKKDVLGKVILRQKSTNMISTKGGKMRTYYIYKAIAIREVIILAFNLGLEKCFIANLWWFYLKSVRIGYCYNPR